MKVDFLKTIDDSKFYKALNNKEPNKSFGDYFKSALIKVNELQNESEKYSNLLASGNIDNIHETMIASEKASIALQLAISVQNKVIDAYKEIMRLQL